MLLQKLHEYSSRLFPAPDMYGKTLVRWFIDLDMKGRFLGLVPAGDGQSNARMGIIMNAPHRGRASGISPKLLADNGEYVLGRARDGSRAERAKRCNEAFIALTRKAADATQEQALKAVVTFYEKTDISGIAVEKSFDPGDILTFRVNGVVLIELPSVRVFWKQYAGTEGKKEAGKGDLMQCLVCGETKTAMRRLAFKVKRLPGGQKSGMALISANSPSFESYGLRESLVAPTCQDCGEKFMKAINDLMERGNASITSGTTVYIFWTGSGTDFAFSSLIARPDRIKVKDLYRTVLRNRRKPHKADMSPFYAAAFSASGGRVAVRDWMDSTVSDVQENLANWFRLQKMVTLSGAKGSPLPVKGYVGKDRKWVPGLIDDLALPSHGARGDGLPPYFFKALMQAAVKGEPLPRWFLHQVVKMNRLERKVTRQRAVLIKMVLLSHHIIEEKNMESLDAENENPAYLCGRLLAVLELIHAKAVNPETTLAERFYLRASSVPESVFGKLLQDARPHLAKLRREKLHAHEWLESQLMEVQSGLKGFPKTMSLEDQGVFSLGYYHQKAVNKRRQRPESGLDAPVVAA